MANHPAVSKSEQKRRAALLNKLYREGWTPLGVAKLPGGKGSAIAEATRQLGLKSTATLTMAIKNGVLETDPSLYKPKAHGAIATPIDTIIDGLRKAPMTLEGIAAAAGIRKGAALDALEEAREKGLNLREFNGKWSLETTSAPTPVDKEDHYVSRKDNRFVFGLASDTHLCSKYERLDVLNDLYDRFARAKVDRVFNAGNWIEGEAPFNKFDVKVYGLEPQLRYLAEHFPQRKGISTYAIWGEDHEGFYARREAVDVGRLAERIMRESGREDWHNIGFMEAFVPLINANTGARCQLLVMHPGGGSAYATSYRPQKIVESLEPGEKPAIVVIGHYHKLSVNLVRNVWALQCGCTKDQDIFMRKKNIDAHVGGMIVEAEQDPQTGAIIGCKVEIIRYFNSGYYQNRWSGSDDVTLPARRANFEGKSHD